MPIYAYRCDACGFRKDALQKMSDPALTTCPSCGEERFAKQLSAPAFQLKGTGWYATDFRDNGKKADKGDKGDKAAEPDTNGVAAGGSGEATGSKTEGGDAKRADGKTDGKTDAGKAGDAGTNGQGGNGAGGAKGTKASRASDGAATPSAAPAPPAKPSPSSTGTSGSGSSAS